MRLTALLAAIGLASCASSPPSPNWQEQEVSRQPRRRKVARPTPAAAATPAPPTTQVHRLAVLAGARSLDDDIWDPVSDELALGLQYSTVGPSGFGIELGAAGSIGTEDELFTDVDITAVVVEIFGGIRKEFDWGKWRPAFGVGGALVAAGIDNDSGGNVPDDEDVSAGYYAHGGIFYDFESRAFVGVDYRILRGTEIGLGSNEGDADYEQVTLVLGIRF